MAQEFQILVVDDNPVNRKVASAMMTKLGYTSDQAVSGEEALSKLSQNTYKIVLMDIRMPGMDGIKATKVIRDESSNVLAHNIPVIALTADDYDGSWQDNGFNDFMSKPLNPKELKDMIVKWIDM